SKHFYIICLGLILFSACKEEESITPRNYPFVNRLGVHTIDETGASIDFEILQEGRASITGYGVEYLESARHGDIHYEPPYLKIELPGAPSPSKETIRIDYDMVMATEYVARPFVHS